MRRNFGRKSKTPAEFVALRIEVDPVTECWCWQGARLPTGYGLARAGATTTTAQRVSYEAFVGPIPEGLEIDHLCRNRRCVNPEHLEVVTRSENMKRAPAHGKALEHRLATHCLRGHPFDEENTYHRPDKPGRQCRACRRYRAHSRRGDKVTTATPSASTHHVHH